jgi:hypothetical protein
VIKVIIPKDERPQDKGKRRILLQIGKYQFHLANFEAHYLIQELKETLTKVERVQKDAMSRLR